MTDEMRAKVEKVMKNLERNKMKPYFCENKEEAQALVKTLIKRAKQFHAEVQKLSTKREFIR